MHDLLFANQNALGREDLLRYSEALKLDIARFRMDLDSDRIRKQVEAGKSRQPTTLGSANSGPQTEKLLTPVRERRPLDIDFRSPYRTTSFTNTAVRSL